MRLVLYDCFVDEATNAVEMESMPKTVLASDESDYWRIGVHEFVRELQPLARYPLIDW